MSLNPPQKNVALTTSGEMMSLPTYFMLLGFYEALTEQADQIAANAAAIAGGSSDVESTTSGTFVDFTVPETATEIVVALSFVGTNGTDDLLIQIGNGSVLESGYFSSQVVSGSAATNTTDGFLIGVDGVPVLGDVVLRRNGTSTSSWVSSHVVRCSGKVGSGSGRVVVGAIDTVRITVTGSDTLDSGQAQVLWR